MAKSFRDLAVFQRSLDLAAEVYRITDNFPRREMYGLTAQIRRAAVRVTSDIAEGAGRNGYPEWRQFLSDARGSLFEVEAQALLALRFGFLSEAGFQLLEVHLRRTGSALVGLLKWVRSKEKEGRRDFDAQQ